MKGGLLMKNFSSREIIKIALADGWYEVKCVGDHHQFKHDTKKGKATIPHPQKSIPLKTAKAILKQLGIKIS